MQLFNFKRAVILFAFLNVTANHPLFASCGEVFSGKVDRVFETYSKEWASEKESLVGTPDEALFAELGRFITTSSITTIRELMARNNGTFTTEDLRALLSYFKVLANNHKELENVRLEFRDEDWMFYVLLEIDDSLVPLMYSSLHLTPVLTITHDHDWAESRFVNKATGPYLVGQQLSRSKFAAVAEIDESANQGQVLDLLGLRGYPVFDNGKGLYVISLKMNQEFLAKFRPKVAILYKIKQEDGTFRTADHFLEGSFPGFTSGGLQEVVIETAEIPASNLDDLKRQGFNLFLAKPE